MFRFLLPWCTKGLLHSSDDLWRRDLSRSVLGRGGKSLSTFTELFRLYFLLLYYILKGNLVTLSFANLNDYSIVLINDQLLLWINHLTGQETGKIRSTFHVFIIYLCIKSTSYCSYLLLVTITCLWHTFSLDILSGKSGLHLYIRIYIPLGMSFSTI